VLGAHAAGLLARIDFLDAEPVICEDWHEGQAASLRCGLAALGSTDRVLVTLGDQPLISSQVIARFIHEPPGTRAVYDGLPGHPVVLGPAQLEALAQLSGDHGARDLLRGCRTIECGHLCSCRDIDTPDDLEAIRNEVRALL
jgi:CTP:molybdopterin cytidylyltransferase MocA